VVEQIPVGRKPHVNVQKERAQACCSSRLQGLIHLIEVRLQTALLRIVAPIPTLEEWLYFDAGQTDARPPQLKHWLERGACGCADHHANPITAHERCSNGFCSKGHAQPGARSLSPSVPPPPLGPPRRAPNRALPPPPRRRTRAPNGPWDTLAEAEAAARAMGVEKFNVFKGWAPPDDPTDAAPRRRRVGAEAWWHRPVGL
jgi:hypothetical protein